MRLIPLLFFTIYLLTNTCAIAQGFVYPVGDSNEIPTNQTTNLNGFRITQDYNNEDLHTGVDLANVNAGDEVRAIGSGTVSLRRDTESSLGFGNVVLIQHDLPEGTFYSFYAHMQDGSVSVNEGDTITTAGQQIGRVGSTGTGTGAHLHFSVRRTNNLGCGYVTEDSCTSGDTFDNFEDPLAFVAAHLEPAPLPPLTPQNISQDATRSGGLRVAVNGQHVYVVWLDVDTRETFFRHSANSGTSFEPRKLLSSGECSFTRAPPGIAVSGNSVHVVYPVIVGSNSTDICYTYSTNHGSDFTTPVRISGGVPAARPLANPLVAADGENVVLAWSESCGGGCQGPYMRRSVNGGIDFDALVDLSFGRRSWGLGYLIVSGDTVYIVSLHEPVSSQTHVYLHRSADAGGTFENAKNLSGDPINQGVPLNGQPAFIVSGSNAYVAWRGTRPPSVPGSRENENIYFRSSSDNGVTWGQYTNLSEGVGYSSFPTIATGNTNVYVSWLDQSPDGRNREIFYRRSTNSGQLFEQVKNFTQALQPSLFNRVPTLVAKGSILYLFWRDELVGEVDIWYRRSRDSGDVFEPPLTELPSNLTENLGLPLSQDTVISESGNVYIVWTDNGMQDIFFQRL